MSVVESHRDGVVGWIVFNRPDVLNAMNAEIFAGFDHCLAAFSAERDIRVIAVTGAGRAFSTGADLHALAGRPASQGMEVGTGGEGAASPGDGNYTDARSAENAARQRSNPAKISAFIALRTSGRLKAIQPTTHRDVFPPHSWEVL